jgi:hypothetical protein
MSALIQNQKICFGRKSQATFGELQTAAEMWSFTKLNGDLVSRPMGIEDDAAEYGKGNEFPENVYATAWDTRGSLNRYLGSQLAAWLFSFGLGNVVLTGSGPYTYVCTPLITTSTLQPPQFNYCQQLPGTDADFLASDCVIDSFQVAFNSGPGRQNSQFSAAFIGSGKLTQPSAITIPALTSDTLLPAGLMAISVLGVNYVSNKNILAFSMGWNNNLRTNEGYFPGSGFQSSGNAASGAIRGRLEVGPRVLTMSLTVRRDSSSAQFAAMEALTQGAVTVTLSADANDSLTISAPQVILRDVQEGNTNGIASVTCTLDALYSVGGSNILTVTAVTNVADICQPA